MLRRSSRAMSLSLSLSDKLMLRRSLFGPRFKAKSLSISGQRKNPDRPPKLRDVKKQVKAVQESQSPIQLEKEEEEEGAKAVQESQSPIQLEKEEEEEAKAVKPCEVCGGAAGSHPSVVCPYLHDVPWHVTSVGEGYKIACWFCWKGQYCRHLKSRLMGSEAANYTASVEDLYEKMLVKIETLTRLVEQSSAKVILEQENHNRKLRYKAARSAGLE